MFKKGKQTIGIALGGGGTRGAAHIGVLQALHRGGMDCIQFELNRTGSLNSICK